MPEVSQKTGSEKEWAQKLRENKNLSVRKTGAGVYQTGSKINDWASKREGLVADMAQRVGSGMKDQGKEINQSALLREQKKQAKQKADKEEGGVITAPIRKGTSALLRQSWINLIPSWGLTLIYINIHIFGNIAISPKFFCKFGEEWVPERIRKQGDKAVKAFTGVLGILLTMLLFALDVLVIGLMFAAIAMFIFLVDMLSGASGLAFDIANFLK